MTAPPFALRLGGQEHALEPGRDYLLGTAADCDLPLPPGAAAHHALLRVGEQGVELRDLGGGTELAGATVTTARLQLGDVLRFGGTEATLVADTGLALMVPIPALRAAAVSRRQTAVRRAAASLRRRDAGTFEELMAAELRRAPWLGTSLLLHALLLLLCWLLAPLREGGDRASASVHVELPGEAAPQGPRAQAPEVVAEVQPDAPTVPPDPLLLPEPEAEEPPPVERADGPLRRNAAVAPRPTRRAAGGGDGDLAAEAQGIGSGGFQRTVAELRSSGLEIVFVFDSTGSMSRTILDTKNTIAQMLTVLRALVPDARIGIVTYRDRGRSEQYVVRELPLGVDFWRASNFVQDVTAEGGGDRPEDVRAGLTTAFRQRWRPYARRVVVLAGDAPPHDSDRRRLLEAVEDFVRNGRSFVHALVTSPDTAGRATRSAFAEIAAAGRGECLDLRAHERVLQHVLALAFGRQHDQDVAAAIAAVTAAAERVDVAALDLAHRGGPDLAEALRRDPVPATLLHALVRRPRRHVALELVELLAARSVPEPTRHAVAWVLQRTLELPAPPVDAETGERPAAEQMAALRSRCGSLPE